MCFDLLASDQADQVTDSFTPDLLDRDTNGSERRGQDAGEDGIIETGQGHIFRDATSRLPQGLNDADGAVVVAGENGIEPGAASKKLGDGSAGLVGLETTPNNQGRIKCWSRFL